MASFLPTAWPNKAMLFTGLLVIGCSGPQYQDPSAALDLAPTNPCGQGGVPRDPPDPVQKTTVEPDGTLIDWVVHVDDKQHLAGPNNSDPNDPRVPQTRTTTVGYPRPHTFQCLCYAGYKEHPGGPCESEGIACLIAGGMTSSNRPQNPCCAGLKAVTPLKLIDGVCAVPPQEDYLLCIQCGDDKCSHMENPCNCPQDCPMPPKP